jgi:ankyrin repeat protein
LKHDISKSNEPQAVEILELIRKAPSKISIIHVVGCLGSGKTTVLSVAKRIQKEGVAIVVRYFKGFSTTLPDPVPALLATFLYETLVQRPDLFPRIQYFVQHFSKQLHVDKYIRLLTHALLKLNFVTFVVLIDDFDSCSPLSVALLTTLHRLAISANSNIKFVVSSESRDIAFTGQVDRTIELDKGKPRSLALEADYSDLFRTRPSLEVYKDQICEKVLEMESSAISPYLILKVLSRLSDVSTPSGLLRHLSFMCFDTRMIYTYYIEDLNTKPLEMVSWSFAALSWIYRGFRPLLENEIGCAAAIAYNPGAASALNKYISIDALDRYAGAFIRKEHDYILPFHESTKVFLLSNPIFSKSSLDGTHLRTDAELTTLSLKYISDFILDVFPRKRYTADGSPSLILPSIPEHQFLDYTCRFWPDHYLRASETIEKDDAENLDQCVLTFLENSLVRQAWHEVYKTQLPSLSPQKVYEPTPLRISCDLGLTRVALKIITDSQTVLDMSELDFALDQAVKSSHAEIVDCLLGLKVKGHFALAYAAQRDDCSLIKRIINNDANINAIDNLGSTAMHVAAKAGSLDACKTLHSLGASIGKLDSNMNSILHLACEGGSEDIVKWLVQAEISVPVNEKNRFGETPLHLAAAFGHAEVVNQLMLSYADVSPKDKHGRMPLDLACENGHLDVMIYLLDESHPRLNPFQFAAKSGCVLTLKTIISDLPNAEKFVQKENALFLATSYDKENAVEYLLQCGADPNKPDVLSPDKMTPLAKAAAMGFTRIIRRLVVAGADVNLLSGINNGSPLHHAASCYQTRAIFELLIVSNHDINAKDGKKQTPLHLAAEKGMKESVKLLLRRGADGDLGDCMGYNALHLAAREGHLPVVDFMISEEYGSIEAITKSGMTALHVAASAGQLEVVRFLISKSLKLIPRLAIGGNQRPSTNLSPSKNPEFVNAKAYCGQTSLHFAASNRQLEVAKLLLASRASNLVDRQGRSALHAASVKGNSDLVKLLLENNFDINLQDNHGDTPVFIAACRGADDIVQQLVQSGADVSLKNSAGWSPLHAAFGYKVITEYLISCKEVDINDKENTGRTALMIAAQNNHPDVVEFLVNAGANLSDQNKDGLTALHFAADQNHPSCLKLLLWEKANIHQRDGQKRTCLRLAASTSRGDLASLAILLSTEDTLDGFRVNWSYDELLEALLGAAEAGNSGAVMRLLREDREILNGRLTNGCTAMETALKHKWIETALLLLSNGGKPWSCGGPYISSIHLALACNQNADEFITAAMERGVNPTASDAFSFLRLALEFERNDIWHKFEDYRENTLEILDSDGWTLNDFLLQAKNPVHATLTSSHKPDAVVVPKTWAYEMTVDNRDNFSLTIDKKGLEVQLSSKLTIRKFQF